jgi:hypothetical protein
MREVFMPEPLRSANLLADQILSNHELHSKLSVEDQKTIRDLATSITKDLMPPAYVTDKVVYRIVVIALGLVCVAAAYTMAYLSMKAAGGTTAAQVPEALTAIGSAAIGALAGLLAPSAKGN